MPARRSYRSDSEDVRDRRRRNRDTRDDSDVEAPQRKSWMAEVRRSARVSGRVHELGAPEHEFRPSGRPPLPASAAVTSSAAPASAPAPAAEGALFSGLVASAVTPFTTSGDVDVQAVADYAAALKADGVTAVHCCGVAGESHLLCVDERKALLQAWRSTGLAVIADVSAESINDTEALARHAQSAGVRAIAIMAPSLFQPQSATDFVGFLSRVASAAPSTPLLVHHFPAAQRSARFRLVEVLKEASSRVASLRGCIFASSDIRDFAACMALKGRITDVIHADDTTTASAAVIGAKAFASMHYSTVAPMSAKLVAAAQKSDAAGLKQFLVLADKYFNMMADAAGCSFERQVAAVKAVTSLRLELDVGHVRVPGPKLTVLEAQRVQDGMAQFVKDYSAAVKGSASAPSATTKINVHAMPGYMGKLDDKIRRHVEACGERIGKRNLMRYFPHIGDPNWRHRQPGMDCAVNDFIDHTVLKPECTAKEVTKLCDEAKKYHFKAVCVNGCRVRQCLDELEGSNVMVAAVIGFPLGAGTIKAKAKEARELVQLGASEIDMVMNVGAMKDGDYQTVFEDIKAVVDASRPGIVKVIFETCLLTADEIMDASILSVAAGAGFVKTSTGFNKGGATPEAIDIMLAVVGNESLVKASGGVRTAPDALAYITAGVKRIGTSSGIAIMTGAASKGGY